MIKFFECRCYFIFYIILLIENIVNINNIVYYVLICYEYGINSYVVLIIIC